MAAKDSRIRTRTDSEKSADSVADSESVTTLPATSDPMRHGSLLTLWRLQIGLLLLLLSLSPSPDYCKHAIRMQLHVYYHYTS